MRIVDHIDLMMNCLHGQKIPASLVKLWDLWEYEQDFLAKCCGIMQLLTSLDFLMEVYGEPFIQESEDVACNIKAHHRLFERLGFFAVTDNRDFLAFDLGSSNSDNPPVVKLDSEGQYSWLGINLEEAIYRLADEYGQRETALSWLRSHRYRIEMVGEFGSSTQFLASLSKLHEQYYWECKGKEKIESSPSLPASIVDHDPTTWLLNRGEDIRQVIDRLYGEEGLLKGWVQCNKDGMVESIRLRAISDKNRLPVQGVGLESHISEVLEIFGEPIKQGSSWMCFERYNVMYHFTIRDEKVWKIHLAAIA